MQALAVSLTRAGRGYCSPPSQLPPSRAIAAGACKRHLVAASVAPKSQLGALPPGHDHWSPLRSICARSTSLRKAEACPAMGDERGVLVCLCVRMRIGPRACWPGTLAFSILLVLSCTQNSRSESCREAIAPYVPTE